MELSWQTITIIVGLIMVVLIVLDGIRRMHRARAEALKLDIKKDFSFPASDHNPELPSGGFRVVGGERVEEPVESATAAPAARAEESPAATAPVQKTSSKPARSEPVLSDSPFSGAADALYGDDDLGPVRVRDNNANSSAVIGNMMDGTQAGEVATAVDEHTSAADPQSAITGSVSSESVSSEVAATEAPESADLDDSTEKMQENIESWLNTRTQEIADELAPLATASIIPKARPVDLDEDVPVLMAVETLGDREVVIEDQPSAVAEQQAFVADDIEPEQSPLGDSEDSQPHLEEEIALQEEQGLDQGSELVIYANDDAEQLSDRGQAEVVLVIHAVSRDEHGFPGRSLLHLFDGCDLRFGSERIFHRFEEADGQGPIQFSVAQTYEPGIFNPATMEEEYFAGLTFFLSLPGANRALEAYQAMSEMARVLADHLNAELKDVSHSTFTKQTIEHDRQQIQEYERRKALKAKKAAVGRRR